MQLVEGKLWVLAYQSSILVLSKCFLLLGGMKEIESAIITLVDIATPCRIKINF